MEIRGACSKCSEEKQLLSYNPKNGVWQLVCKNDGIIGDLPDSSVINMLVQEVGDLQRKTKKIEEFLLAQDS